MKLDADERMVIEQMRNLASGDLNTTQVNNFLKSLMMIVLCDFSENDSTKIPYFGELKIEYLGDVITDKGRVADLNVKFTPSPTLVKNIGQLVDVKNPNCDTTITQVECIKEIMNDISKKLNEIMDKNN